MGTAHLSLSAVVGTAAALALASVAGAAISLVSSTATIVHTSNLGTTPPSRTTGAFTPANFPSTGVAAPPLTLPLGALVAGGANTTAKAGIGTVTSNSFIGVVLASGTSLTQKGNLNTSPGSASTLAISFSATWQVVGSFAAGLSGASLSTLGSLPANPPPGPSTPSPTAFFKTALSASFMYTTGVNPALPFRSAISTSTFLNTNFQGPFSLSSSDLLSSSPGEFMDGTLITVAGTITYSIHNDGQEADMRLQSPEGNAVGFPIPGDVPAPSAAALVGMGGLLAARRRRS
ncbi:MAG: hypothetical protein ACKVS8_11505 [Phycisphaerales bacterium]